MNSISVQRIEDKARDLVREEAEKHVTSLSDREANLHRGRAEGAMKLLDFIGMSDYANHCLMELWGEILADSMPTG